jgi:hypothetical protein
MRSNRCIAAFILALLAVAPAAADEFVIFANGKAMRVEKTRRDGKWLYLDLGAEQEMAVLARQVKEVEVSPSALRSVLANSGLANVLGIGGGGGASYTPPPVAEAYEAGEMVAEEGAAAVPVQPQVAPPAVPQGQELVPRGGRRGGRAPRGSN